MWSACAADIARHGLGAEDRAGGRLPHVHGLGHECRAARRADGPGRASARDVRQADQLGLDEPRAVRVEGLGRLLHDQRDGAGQLRDAHLRDPRRHRGRAHGALHRHHVRLHRRAMRNRRAPGLLARQRSRRRGDDRPRRQLRPAGQGVRRGVPDASASRRRRWTWTAPTSRRCAASRFAATRRTATTTTSTATATASPVRAMTTKRLAVLASAARSRSRSRAPSAVAGSKAPVAPTTPGFEDVNFVSLCRFSHTKPDDPIVFPGQAGLSHDHTFFGSITTDANSTPDESRRDADDLRSDHRHRGVLGALALRQRREGHRPRRRDLLPAEHDRTASSRSRSDFMMIGGDSTASTPQTTNVVFWNCSIENVNPSQSVPNCGSAALRLHVIFPECWDGTRTDSPDHKQHMAYATNGACPADHPVAVPQVVHHPPLSRQRRGRDPRRLGRPVLRPCRLRQRLEPGSADAARQLLPELAPPLRKQALSRRAQAPGLDTQ